MPKSTSSFIIDVADIVRQPGKTRRIELDVVAGEDIRVTDTLVSAEANVQLLVKLAVNEVGIMVTGSAKTVWGAPCRRCLDPVSGTTSAEFDELYRRDFAEGESYPLNHDKVDLSLAFRDAILLELPLAPTCKDDCAGLCPICGTNRNEDPCTCVEAAIDPRFAGLADLKFDE